MTGMSGEDDEKQAQAQAQGQGQGQGQAQGQGRGQVPINQSIALQYPEIPPPAYSSVDGQQNLNNASNILLVPGATVSAAGISNPTFVAIPAMRYDTMTSYVEDGSGVQTIVTTGAILDRPIMVRCPFCKTTVTTETRPTTGCLTWLCCIALSAVGLFYGCCLLPFCSRRLRDVEHVCPKCHNLVALYKRI